MKSSRIFATPSTREGFGMAALEANACGLPVVTVKHRMNAVMDLVTKETGAVCQPTEQAIAGAICRTLQKKEKMRGRCIEEAKKYDWEEICDLAVDHDLFVISDEIYEKIIYDHEHISIGSLPGMAERTVTINGFSKAYAMTGWRLGYLTGPKETMKWVIRLLSHSVSQATTFVQRAGVVALQGPQDDIDMMVAEFRARRDILVAGLNRLGIPCSVPGGAFYVFPDVSGFGGGDLFTERLLKEALIAATPGSAFGPGGRDYVRLSYATSQNRIRQALDRIEKLVICD